MFYKKTALKRTADIGKFRKRHDSNKQTEKKITGKKQNKYSSDHATERQYENFRRNGDDDEGEIGANESEREKTTISAVLRVKIVLLEGKQNH